MIRLRRSRRLIMAIAVAAAFALSALTVTLTGVGTSPSNQSAVSDQPGASELALRLPGISGESKRDGHEQRIEVL